LQLLEEWDAFRKRGDFFKMPDFAEVCTSAVFIDFCNDKLKEFLHWKRESEEIFLSELSRLFTKFRVSAGRLEYDDLINLSVDLLREQSVIEEIESAPFFVVLDEAQDTDAQQFRLLVGISQKNLRNGLAIDVTRNFPEGGHFSMVGDPQQSIYCDRTDVNFYTGLHQALINSSTATELIFSVTMRCSLAVVNFVNSKFSNIFSDVRFVPLIPKPGCQVGETKILKMKNAASQDFVTQVAGLFKNVSPNDFGVQKWADVAVLAPRKDWLLEIGRKFASQSGFPPIQLHFNNTDDNFAHPIRWLASCLRYINNPANRREFAGILREIFGLKSQEIIDYFRHDDCQVCAHIDAIFSDIRRERHDYPLSKFLMKILDTFKIFERIQALKIFSEQDFLMETSRTVELCFFAESANMNIVEAENFLVAKINDSKMCDEVNPSAIQFITFHKCKGLEWPVVIIPFLHRRRQLKGDGRGKSLPREEQLKNLFNNECRLLYVACTRAKNKLWFLNDSEFSSETSPTNTISTAEILFKHFDLGFE
jgi:ATP-dependent exoDNAse (exonuclease V) beta subunit